MKTLNWIVRIAILLVVLAMLVKFFGNIGLFLAGAVVATLMLLIFPQLIKKFNKILSRTVSALLFMNLIFVQEPAHAEPAHDNPINEDLAPSRLSEYEQVKQFGPAPERNQNGVYQPVLDYLKINSNNPINLKIISCSRLKPVNSGWLIECDYQDKIMYDEVVLNYGMFVIAHEKVEQVRHLVWLKD